VLREFLTTEAQTNAAYGFEVLRMINNMKTYDKCQFWTYRLHAYQSHFTLPLDTLHFEPVPEQITQDRRFDTHFRLLHRASLTEQHRKQRFAKYCECDPNNDWQASYKNLLSEPGDLKTLTPRNNLSPIIIEK
jgi:hypothetical protein